MLSPIILFLYNRPWHTMQTLDALAKNELAKDSILYIFCDGIKENAKEIEINNIYETRKIANIENRFKEIIVIEQESNKGLANSIIDGVTEIVNKYGKVIVLEDDIVTSPGFLKYMNDALDMYENEEKVMHISGYMYPIVKKYSDTFFLKTTSCWGWATWSSSWKYFEKNIDKQMKEIDNVKGWNEFTINSTQLSFKTQLELNKSGVLNTWAIFWYASVFLRGGTSLHPFPSLVQNIGFDGTGENCGEGGNAKSPFTWSELAKNIDVVRKNKLTSKKEYLSLQHFFNKIYKNKIEMTIRDRFYLFRQRQKLYFINIFRALLMINIPLDLFS